MAKTDTFRCSVVTPERVVLECDARFVAFPAHDGEIGVLTHRAPLVCRMGIGTLRIDATGDESDGGGEHLMFVDGGFAQVVDNRLTLLTEQAKEASDLDAPAAEQAMVEARAMKIPDDTAYDARAKAMKRAQVQLKLARSVRG